jgi:hypothetical protein
LLDIRCHTNVSLDQAAALRDAFNTFAAHALMLAGLDIRRGLSLDPHSDEVETWTRDYASRDITSAVDEVSPLSTRSATAVVPPGKSTAKARR